MTADAAHGTSQNRPPGSSGTGTKAVGTCARAVAVPCEKSGVIEPAHVADGERPITPRLAITAR